MTRVEHEPLGDERKEVVWRHAVVLAPGTKEQTFFEKESFAS